MAFNRNKTPIVRPVRTQPCVRFAPHEPRIPRISRIGHGNGSAWEHPTLTVPSDTNVPKDHNESGRGKPPRPLQAPQPSTSLHREGERTETPSKLQTVWQLSPHSSRAGACMRPLPAPLHSPFRRPTARSRDIPVAAGGPNASVSKFETIGRSRRKTRFEGRAQVSQNSRQ